MAIEIVKTTDFDEKVLGNELPVLVDFWAAWCGPCRMLGPVIEELADELEGEAVVGKVNVDEEQELAARYGVMTIPTVVAYKQGEEIGRIVGVQPKEAILKLIR